MAEAQQDESRLRAVRATGLADEQGSAVLDALARVALRLLDVPVTLVTLVDEHRQFMPGAAQQRPVALGRSVPVDQSICRHAVRSGEPLVIDDARDHPLTKGSAAVSELGVGAYLGVPLDDGQGHVLGAFCAVDFAPRAWSDRDRSALDELAAAARAELTRAELALRERLAVEELRASEARFRTVLDALREGVVLQDRSDAIQLANPAARRILGLDDLEGRSSYDPWAAIKADGSPFLPEEHPSVVAFRSGLAQQGIEMGVRRGDGSRVWLSIDALPILVPGEATTSQVVATFRDVTKEREATRAAAHLAAIVSSTAMPIVSTELDGTIRTWNRAAETMFGYPAADVVGRTMRALTPPEQVDREELSFARARAGEPAEEIETLRRRADGAHLTVGMTVSPVIDGSGVVIALSTLFRDVTHAKQLEAELRQAQKLEAMGRLAGGIAHDFNNLLAVIQANAEIVREELEDRPDVSEDVEEIVRTVGRASELTRQLLAFGRKQVVSPRRIPVDEVVEGAASMLRRLLGDHIHLTTEHDASAPRVHADRGQLEQVLVNLVVNARDAMPQGGELRIVTRRGAAGARPSGAPSALVFEAPHVLLSVRDSGTGMDAQTIANAFEPFFTTKEEARGTGLGLATVYGIATQASGIAWITSQLGEGTTVWLALPLAADDAPGSGAPGTAGALG